MVAVLGVVLLGQLGKWNVHLIRAAMFASRPTIASRWTLT